MKKAKEQIIPTRKRKALRRTAVFLALLALSGLFSYGRAFPAWAVRYTEETYNIGRTQVVKRLRPPKELKLGTALFYLTENEHALLVSAVRFYPLYGWVDAGGGFVDCTKDAPIHVGAWSVSRMGDENDEGVQYLFGRIDDPAVSSINVRVSWRDFNVEEEVYNTAFIVATAAEDWTQKDGKRYFVCQYDGDWKPFQDTYHSSMYYFSDALDAEGRVLYTQSHEETGIGSSALG